MWTVIRTQTQTQKGKWRIQNARWCELRINLTRFTSGVFTAPASGIYLFATYALTVGGFNGAMFIKKNDQILCRAEVGDGETWHAAACTAVAELTPEDSVRVTGEGSRPVTIYRESSGFAGHLIQEYV